MGTAKAWFTGQLCLPDGEITAYVHAGFGTQYERYILLDIDRGALVGTTVMDGEEHERSKRDRRRRRGRSQPG